MFAHQVIEDLKGLNPESDERYEASIAIVCLGIKQAQKFHMGEFGDLCQFFKKMKGKRLFLDEDVSYGVRLPYKECWFDSTHAFDEIDKTDENIGNCSVPKRGIYAIELEKDLIIATIFNYVSHPYVIRPTWLLGFQSYTIKIGGFIDESIKTNIVPGATSETYFNQTQSDPSLIHRTCEDDSNDLWLLNMFLMFLNCKNIGTETVPAPVKLNNKRKKKGKLPIFSYKTLVIKPTSKQQKSIPKHLWSNRIHLSRGHWKTYTAEKPLLGKHIGRYWWQEQVRGQNKKGVVMKDYRVEA